MKRKVTRLLNNMALSDIYIVLEGHDFYNEAQTMTQVFYPNRKYILAEEVLPFSVTVRSALFDDHCSAFVYEGGQLMCTHEEAVEGNEKKQLKACVKICIFHALKKYTGISPKWGSLTGIRPAKLARELFEAGNNHEQVLAVLGNDYLVSAEKAGLAASVAAYEMKVLHSDKNEGTAHLYVGIPFCPTTCLYCSFTSYPIGKYAARADEYLDCLEAEIDSLPDVLLRSVYIGGGTPTSLDEAQFERLLSIVAQKFETHGIEYTVEAGRPDTITQEKLELMKKYGVNRLSINPQTMNDKTLELIGRRHSSADVVRAFEMARNTGFNNINMDLILGLPGENTETVKSTMESIAGLAPDSITVHTLAVKRASRLNENLSGYELGDGNEIEKMLELTSIYAYKMGMLPYSMYRQKNMLGNFENVGWCMEGSHSIFNIETLEETATILAAGAGAVTKLVKGEKISRIFNVKNVEEYMARIDEIIANKKALKLDL